MKAEVIVIRNFSACHNQIHVWKCVIKRNRVSHVIVLITVSLPDIRVSALPKHDISWQKVMLQAETSGQLSVVMILTATNIVARFAMWLVLAMSTNKVGENSSPYFCCVSLIYNYFLENICNWKTLSVFCLGLNFMRPENDFFFHLKYSFCYHFQYAARDGRTIRPTRTTPPGPVPQLWRNTCFRPMSTGTVVKTEWNFLMFQTKEAACICERWIGIHWKKCTPVFGYLGNQSRWNIFQFWYREL